MTDNAGGLKRKIASARDLGSVVRTMKAIAASNITQYENAVGALEDYNRTVELGLLAGFRQNRSLTVGRSLHREKESSIVGAIVFGSDQGLVGQFNESLAGFVRTELGLMSGKKRIWSIGERIAPSLCEHNLLHCTGFPLPNSISAIAHLVSQILLELESLQTAATNNPIYLFHNQPKSGAVYQPVMQRLLPLDEVWWQELSRRHWPTGQIPEVVYGNQKQNLLALIGEYLFVSLYRACVESLASENASRLAAMQRAEKNIAELLGDLELGFNRLRQSAIDEELFDVISGFEAINQPQEKTN